MVYGQSRWPLIEARDGRGGGKKTTICNDPGDAVGPAILARQTAGVALKEASYSNIFVPPTLPPLFFSVALTWNPLF